MPSAAPGMVVAALLAAVPAHALEGAPPTAQVVSTERLLEAMTEVRAYDLTATANGPRLQADVVLRLMRSAGASDPGRAPLLIGHREWFAAFLARTGLPAEKAPLYVRRPYEVGQDLLVDYRREAVIDAVLAGPTPRGAANVRIFWPKSPGSPDQYSYDDTGSRPTLRVTQKRLITYRLVDYEDRLWYAEVAGLHGRPTSGALGLLFDLIGEARIEESRSAFTTDGLQVLRTRASKWGLERTVTATVWPDGHADRGLPPGRPDLQGLEARLREARVIRFHPLPPVP